LADTGAARLAAAGVDEAETKASWWVAEALGVRREELAVVWPDAAATTRISEGFDRLVDHEPLQYVIGHTPFLGLSLLTDARALIPRPETEELAARILADTGFWARGSVRLADVGTGTGCLAIALAAAHPEARIAAIDRSPEALTLAAANIAATGVGDQVVPQSGDLLDGVAEGELDGVVSNPPYIATPVWAGLDPSVRAHEPRLALDGGPDGLAVIRRLVVQAFTRLKNGGRLWLEIGDEQGAAVRDLLEAAGFGSVTVHRDAYGQTRFVAAEKP
jgi:release factor glutamine methyltransferase